MSSISAAVFGSKSVYCFDDDMDGNASCELHLLEQAGPA